MLKKSKMKVLSMVLLIAVVASALVVPTSASGRGTIEGFSGDRVLADTYVLGQSDSGLYSGNTKENTYEINVHPGDEIRIPLTADMFIWANSKNPLPMESVRLSDLLSGKLKIRTQKQAGGVVLDYVQLDTDTFAGKPFYTPGSTLVKTSKTAYISVMFAEEYVSIKEQEFTFDVYLSVDGIRDDDMRITLHGTMSNPTISADGQTGYIDTSDGTVIEASDVNRGALVDAGKGVTINRILLPGKKYYATCAIKPASDPGFGEEFPDVYPSVVAAYKMNTVNMRYGKSNVKLEPEEGGEYFVYGEDMSYLGKTSETLHYSDYYFLSKEEIPSFEVEKYLDNFQKLPSGMSIGDIGYDTGEDTVEQYVEAEIKESTLDQEPVVTVKPVSEISPKQ